MLYLFGVGEVAISMSGDPKQPDRLIHPIRAVGTVTNGIGNEYRDDAVGLLIARTLNTPLPDL